MEEVIDKVMEVTTVKAFVVLLVSWVGAFIAPVQGFLIFTLCLVICDTYTGIRAAKKRGEKIRSRGLRRTTEKFVMYMIAIMLAEGATKVFNIPVQYFPITYIVSAWIAYHELKSNYENISEVTGVDLWEKVKGALSQFFNSKSKNDG